MEKLLGISQQYIQVTVIKKLEQFISLHYTTFSLPGNSIRRQLNRGKKKEIKI